MDDDLLVPRNMDFGKRFFATTHAGSNEVGAVTYSINPVSFDKFVPSLVHWQRIEYKMMDFAETIQSKFSTVLYPNYPNNTVSLWRKDLLIRCLRDHDTVHCGMFIRMGMWLTKHHYVMRRVVSFADFLLCLDVLQQFADMLFVLNH